MATYLCINFTTYGPESEPKFCRWCAQLIILGSLYGTMALPNATQSEKSAIYTVHNAFEELVQTRAQVKALPDSQFIGSFCT